MDPQSTNGAVKNKQPKAKWTLHPITWIILPLATLYYLLGNNVFQGALILPLLVIVACILFSIKPGRFSSLDLIILNLAGLLPVVLGLAVDINTLSNLIKLSSYTILIAALSVVVIDVAPVFNRKLSSNNLQPANNNMQTPDITWPNILIWMLVVTSFAPILASTNLSSFGDTMTTWMFGFPILVVVACVASIRKIKYISKRYVLLFNLSGVITAIGWFFIMNEADKHVDGGLTAIGLIPTLLLGIPALVIFNFYMSTRQSAK